MKKTRNRQLHKSMKSCKSSAPVNQGRCLGFRQLNCHPHLLQTFSEFSTKRKSYSVDVLTEIFLSHDLKYVKRDIRSG